jgi:hypothetical protein
MRIVRAWTGGRHLARASSVTSICASTRASCACTALVTPASAGSGVAMAADRQIGIEASQHSPYGVDRDSTRRCEEAG